MLERYGFEHQPRVLALTETVGEGVKIAEALANEGIYTKTSLWPDDPQHKKGETPDLVILDIDRFDIKKFTSGSNLRYIAMSSITHPGFIADAFEAGAENFLPKPIDEQDLRFQAVSVLRRTLKPYHSPFIEKPLICESGITLDDNQMIATFKGSPLVLSSKEYNLLRYFVLNKEKPLAREAIFQAVWSSGNGSNNEFRSVDVYISNLRKKIGEERRNPQRIVSIHGFGYVFKPEV